MCEYFVVFSVVFFVVISAFTWDYIIELRSRIKSLQSGLKFEDFRVGDTVYFIQDSSVRTGVIRAVTVTDVIVIAEIHAPSEEVSFIPLSDVFLLFDDAVRELRNILGES